ncbi:MAG: hypothetical protein ABJI82_07170, partial [Alphaproteobacteria bacterium]
MAKQVSQQGNSKQAAAPKPGEVPAGGKAAQARAALPEVDDLLAPDDVPAPLYLRWKLHLLLGGALTVLWFVLVLDFIEKSLGLGNLTELLPHEVGGLAAGAFTPVAFLWMLIAFFGRGRQLRQETAILRSHLKQLIYPSDRADSRMQEITASLRNQTKELLSASEEAARRGQALGDLIRDRTRDLAQVSEDADLRAHAVADALKRQTADLSSASERAAERARDAGETLFEQAHGLTVTTDRASARAEDMIQTLKRRAEELDGAAQEASDRTLKAAEAFDRRTE